MGVCGAVIARDEEKNIDRCVLGLGWADSVLVVLDDRTRDATAARASRLGARVEVCKFENFAKQRNAALRAAESDWILFVDADEVVTPPLAEEIRRVTSHDDPVVSGYWIPRENLIFGRRVRHAGWSPDFQLRLLRRGEATYREDRTVHELVDLRGEARHLSNPLVHHNYATIGQFLAKQRLYASMEAADMGRRGTRVRPWNYLLQPGRQFWRRFVLLRGYGDGALGLLLSLLLAYYELRLYLELRNWEQGNRE